MENGKIKQWVRNNKGKIFIFIVVALVICAGSGSYLQEVGKENTSNKDVKKKKNSKELQKVSDNETKNDLKKSLDEVESVKDSKTKNATEQSDKNSLTATDEISENRKNVIENSLDINKTTNHVTSGEEKENEEKKLVNESEEKVNTDVADNAPAVGQNPAENNITEGALKEPRWVVDQPAWTENISEPVYEMQEMSVCNLCGSNITGSENNHLKEHMMNGENGSWRSEYLEIQVGTNTYEVYHEQVGHWE